MKIVILSIGTRGDVQPYVALGSGLQAAGHQVTLATSPSFAQFVIEHGLRHAPLSLDAMDMMQTSEGRAALGGKGIIALMRQMRPLMRQMLDEGWQAAQGAGAIIYNPKALGGYHIAEKLGVPAFLAHPVPVLAPTGAFAVPALPVYSLGSTLNRLSYQLVLGAAQGPLGGMINQWRKDVLGLPPARRQDHLGGQPIPILYGFSRHLVPPPADWGAHIHVTGSWFLDHRPDWQPSVALVRFLEAGPAPVYIGFGSMAGRNVTATTEAVLGAVRRAGVRAVLNNGIGGLEANAGQEDVFVLRDAPHDWLFPQMAAVVHHGGGGTTAAACRAGTPQLICPFFADQPFWGRRVTSLGVGLEPLPQKKLSTEALAERLVRLASDRQMQQRAAALGAQVRAERGVANAVAVINEYLGASAIEVGGLSHVESVV